MCDKIQPVSRQPKNLKRIVTKNNRGGGSTPPAADPGCYKCNRCKVACPVLKEGRHFSSTNTKKVYSMKRRLTCDSAYIVYLATCLKCSGQYVGKSTNPFKIRHSGHKQEIKNNRGGLGHHYCGQGHGCGYEKFSVKIIDQVEYGDTEALAECEAYWQHQLRCYVENGGNAHCYRKELTRNAEAS